MLVRKIRPWQRGDRLTAARLNATTERVNLLLGRAGLLDVTPNAVTGESPEEEDSLEDEEIVEEDVVPPDEVVDDPVVAIDEVWEFVTELTSTTRITDADDANTYVDVTKTRNFVVLTPAGKLIKIKLEA